MSMCSLKECRHMKLHQRFPAPLDGVSQHVSKHIQVESLQLISLSLLALNEAKDLRAELIVM